MRARSLTVKATMRAMSGAISLAMALGGWSAATGWVSRLTTGPSVTRSQASHWHFGRTSLPPAVTDVARVSCGSPRLCLAVGYTGETDSVLLRSTDGGMTWTEGQGSAPAGSFTALSCVTATRCMATVFIGARRPGGVATSTDGGLTWHADRSFPLLKDALLTVLTCVTASVCYVFNAQAHSYLTGGIERTSDFGGHWTAQHVSGTDASVIDSVDGASCATASACVAVAGWTSAANQSPILQTSNGGGTWTVRVAPTRRADLDAVSCAGGGDCMAAGGGTGAGPDAVVSVDGGVTWNAAARPQALGLAFAVACTAAQSCVLAGQVGGSGLANTGVVARTSDLGGHWSVTKTARGRGFPTSLSCPAPLRCVAARNSDGAFLPTPAGAVGFYASVNGGASWQLTGLPLGLAELQSVSCPTASVCFAAGGTGGPADEATVLRSANGGNTWRTVLMTRRMQTLSALSCPTAAECVAVGTLNFGVGNGLARTADGGRHWQVSRPPAGVVSLTSISCPTAAFCEAIGRVRGRAPTRLLRSADGGRRWTVSRAPGGVAYLLGLSCPSSRVCTAVGDGIHPPGPAVIVRTVDGGRHWTRQPPPHGATILDSVSCPDTRDCDAFSDTSPATIAVTRDAGAHWSVQHLAGVGGQASPPTFLSCVTRTLCAGVVTSDPFSGTVIETSNGATWREPALPAGTQWLLGISCDLRRCIAVGVSGQVVVSGQRR